MIRQKFNRNQQLAAKSFKRYMTRELNFFIRMHNFIPSDKEHTSQDEVVLEHIDRFKYWMRASVRHSQKKMSEENVNIHGEKIYKRKGPTATKFTEKEKINGRE